MLNFESYNQKYLQAYKKESEIKPKTIHIFIKNNFFIFFLLLLPFLFTFSLEIYKFPSDTKNNNFIINKQVYLENDTAFIQDFPKIQFDKYSTPEKKITLYESSYVSKLDRLVENYKNSFSNKFLYFNNKNKSVKLKNSDELLKLNEKKKKFIEVMLPLVIHQNNKILVQRARLNAVKEFLNENKTLSKKDQKFVNDLSKKYLISTTNKHKIDTIDVLLNVVDVIPKFNSFSSSC